MVRVYIALELSWPVIRQAWLFRPAWVPLNPCQPPHHPFSESGHRGDVGGRGYLEMCMSHRLGTIPNAGLNNSELGRESVLYPHN